MPMIDFLLLAEAVPANSEPTDWFKIYDQSRHWVAENGLVFLRNLVVAAAIFVIGRMVANFSRRIIIGVFDTRKMDPTVSRFVANIASSLIVIMVVITALGQLGIPTAQFAALIAAAGLAIGLALQGNLSNFAAGFLLIFFRPFKKGDYVGGGGTEGIIEEIGVFTTMMTTPDNKLIIIPNSKLTADNIINYTAHDKRRVDLTFIVGLQNPSPLVRELLLNVSSANSKVLKTPTPEALVKECNGRLVWELRVWCRTEQYWSVYFELTDAVGAQFIAKGVGGPIPLQVVQMAK